MNKFDAPPYVSKSSSGSIPFVNFGGMWLVSGASYDPAVLKGLTHAQIAAAMHDPTSDVAKAIDGTANVLSAAICSITNHAPASVCNTKAVASGSTKLVAK